MSCNFTKKILIFLMLLLPVLQVFAEDQQNNHWQEILRESASKQKISYDEYLKKSAVSREVIDGFLRGSNWARFDPELGYVLGNSLMPWGIDRSAAIETVQDNGARTTIMYADRNPRINTYGDSFTESAQVSDGETWQEYLAAHLGEPVRNFGVGGYGLYQAYRRMIREESTNHGADYVILYICCDDSTRSLYRSRYATIYPWFKGEVAVKMFHANFWSNVEMDLKTGRLVEKEQLLPTKESLYHMTEPQWVLDHLKDDLAVQLYAYVGEDVGNGMIAGSIQTLDRKRISQLAARLDFPFDWSQESTLRSQAMALLDRYSSRATQFILDKARAFAYAKGKKLLIVLNDPYRALVQMAQSGTRYDQEVVDYLVREKCEFFDMNEVHLRELKQSKLSYEDYIRQYLVDGSGHYSPKGNHFFAYSIKDKIVQWLDPKPIPYQNPGAQSISFRGYLRGGAHH